MVYIDKRFYRIISVLMCFIIMLQIIRCETVYASTVISDAWDGSVDIEWEGYGTPNCPYLITSAQELAGLAERCNKGENFKGKFFKQTRDITLNENCENYNQWDSVSPSNQWKIIGKYDNETEKEYAFYGNYDGGNYTVSGLYISGDEKCAGLFGYMGGAVANLNITNSFISTSNTDDKEAYAGLLIGCGDIQTGVYSHDQGYASGCSGYGVVSLYSFDTGDAYVGGLCGNIAYINNSVNYGKVYANGSDDGNVVAGGIAGYIKYGRVVNCTNYGMVTSVKHAGGITGACNNVYYYSCSNNAQITAKGENGYGGGICGDGYVAHIYNCYNTGSISGEFGAGGLSGCSAEAYNSYNTGSVSSSGKHSGGIHGYTSGDTYNCYNTASVYGKTNAGGIYGSASYYSDTCLFNCYNMGVVSGESRVGTIAGYAGGLILGQNYYYSFSDEVKGLAFYPKLHNLYENTDWNGSTIPCDLNEFKNGNITSLLNSYYNEDVGTLSHWKQGENHPQFDWAKLSSTQNVIYVEKNCRKKLTIQYTPAEYGYEELNWSDSSSSKKSKVENISYSKKSDGSYDVSADLVGVDEGYDTIIIKTSDNNAVACTVVVWDARIVLDAPSDGYAKFGLDKEEHKTARVTGLLDSEYYSIEDLKWKISNSNVANVLEEGYSDNGNNTYAIYCDIGYLANGETNIVARFIDDNKDTLFSSNKEQIVSGLAIESISPSGNNVTLWGEYDETGTVMKNKFSIIFDKEIELVEDDIDRAVYIKDSENNIISTCYSDLPERVSINENNAKQLDLVFDEYRVSNFIPLEKNLHIEIPNGLLKAKDCCVVYSPKDETNTNFKVKWGIDNNTDIPNYINDYPNFTKGYYVNREYIYNAVNSGALDVKNAITVLKESTKEFKGSCLGMVTVVGLYKNNLLSLDDELFDGEKTMNKLKNPIYSTSVGGVMDIFNYFQLIEKTTDYPSKEKSVNLENSLQVISEAKKSIDSKIPIIMCVEWEKGGGHALLAYDYKLSGDEYWFRCYDASDKSNVAPCIIINKTNGAVRFEHSSWDNRDKYVAKRIGCRALSEIEPYIVDDKSENKIKQVTYDGTYIYIPSSSTCSIKNAEGQILNYSEEEVTGDLEPMDIRFTDMGTCILKLPVSGSFTITGSGVSDCELVNDTNLYMVSGENISSIVFTENQLKVDGKNMNTDIGVLYETGGSEFVEYKNVDSNHITVNYNFTKTMVSLKTDSNSPIHTTVYKDFEPDKESEDTGFCVVSNEDNEIKISSSNSVYTLGDVNRDLNVTKEDAALLLRYIAGIGGDISLSESDINKDDVTDIKDVIGILNYSKEHELIEVWDFGADEIEGAHNNLTVDSINALFPNSPAGSSNVEIDKSFTAGILTFNYIEGKHRLRTSNTDVTRYDSNTATEKITGFDCSALNMNGCLYINSANGAKYNLQMNLAKDDVVTMWIKFDTADDAMHIYDDEGNQIDMYGAAIEGSLNGTVQTFIAPKAGTYTFHDGTTGKPRIYRITKVGG